LDTAYSKTQSHEDFCSPAHSGESGSRQEEHTWHSSFQSSLPGTEQGLLTGVCPFYHSPPPLHPPLEERKRITQHKWLRPGVCGGERIKI